MSVQPADVTHLLMPSFAAQDIVQQSTAAYYLACAGIDAGYHMSEVERHFLKMADHLGFDVVKRDPAVSPSSNAEAA